jgi:hypothetical protein
MTRRLLPFGLVALGLLVACGKSSSHRQPDAEATGGADDEPHGAGKSATSGSSGAAAMGGNGASGGNAVGGSSSPHLGGAGAGGADGSPPLALPTGCRPRAPEETADTCSLAVDCDASPSLRTYCFRLDSGAWECQCGNQESIHRLQDVAGLEACALAAQLCSGRALELGEETCERASESSEQERCGIEFACGKPVALGDISDARASLMRFGSARCVRYASAQAFTCNCMHGRDTNTYSLLAESGAVACGPFADFCMSGADPVFDGEERCLPAHATSDGESCYRGEACAPEMALSDDVSLALLEDRYAECVASPGGGSDCSCSNHESGFSFHLATPPNDAACASSIHNCDPNAVTEATGPASCEPLNLDSSGEDMCSAFLSCVQAATVDDRRIVAKGYLSLMCRRTENGMPWKCACGIGPDTTTFELGALGATAAQACTQAPAGCLERLGGVHLGPIMDPVPLPDPLL